MTIDSQAVVPYSLSVQFYGGGISALVDQPLIMTIYQEEFVHDIVEMTFWGGDIDSQALTSGLPVFVTFGRPGAHRVFYGYVNHARRQNNALSTVSDLADRNSITITCVGASWPLKETGNKGFVNCTVPQVVQQIAAQFGLAASVGTNSVVWPSLQMAGKSYWQFLVGLAQRIGYTFYCNGTQLVCQPRQVNPRNLRNVAAVYDYKYDPSSLPVFTPVVGLNTPSAGELRTRSLSTVDPITGNVVYREAQGSGTPTMLGSKTAVPLFTKTEHFTADSLAEVSGWVGGAALGNQMYVAASARAAGNCAVAQGSLIYVMNANGAQNGLWFVKKATHCLDRRLYEMTLELGRDSTGVTAGLNVVPQTASLPSGRLVNGAWRA